VGPAPVYTVDRGSASRLWCWSVSGIATFSEISRPSERDEIGSDAQGRAIRRSVPAAAARAAPDAFHSGERERVIELIHRLEDFAGWEMSGIVAAKAWTAREMRRALDMDVPESRYADHHEETQKRYFEEDQQREAWLAEVRAARGS